MGPERSRLLYLVRLPAGIFVEHAVLDTRLPLEGLPHPCMLVMPGPPQDYDEFHRRLTRPSLDDSARALDWFEDTGGNDDDLDRYWGWAPAVDLRQREVISAHVHRVVVVVSVDGEPAEDDARAKHSDQIGLGIDYWVDAVGQWLEVLVGLDLGRQEVQSGFRPRYVYPLPLVDSCDGRWRSYPTMTQGPTVHHTSPNATLMQWELAVGMTNADESPPEEHLLLRDSRAAWLRDDRRKALIDAVTAVEVALATDIQRSLGADADAGAVRRVLKNVSGVVELHDLAVALGATISVSRARLVDRLAARRNAAVHRGVAPTAVELSEALRTADSVVRAVSPLDGATDPWPLGSVSSQLTAR